MKNFSIIAIVFLFSCQNKPKNKVSFDNKTSPKSNTLLQKKQVNLFVIDYEINKNYVEITAPENTDFELPDTSANVALFKVGDFNADNKQDLMVSLGACGTGGCMYAIFLNEYGNFYNLSFMDYLKNPEFETDKNGLWIIKSSEEIEAYNPSKLQISIFKLDKNKEHYDLDTTFVHQDKME